MASVARFDGTGYFTMNMPAGTSNVWTFRWQIQADAARAGQDSFYYIVGQAALNQNVIEMQDTDSTPANKACDSRANATNLNLSCPNADFISSPTTIEIVSDGINPTELFIDGVSQDTDTSIETFDEASEYIGRHINDISDPFDLYFVSYEENGILRNLWVPPADGVGIVMPDIIGGADATATGFIGNPFVPVSTSPIIDTVKGLPTGVTIESAEQDIPFTYSNDDPTTMQLTSDDGKALDVAFTASLGAGLFDAPPLLEAVGYPYFTDTTSSPTKTVFLRAATVDGQDDFELTFEPEAPYLVVTMDATALAASAGDPARIDANWTTKLVAGEQILLDSNIATIDTGAILTIITTDPNFTSTAYVVDDAGMQTFEVTSGGVIPPDDGIPLDQRNPPWKLALYLRNEEGFEGALNDAIYNWLGSLGYEGTFNERFFQYWGDLGYEGSYADRRYCWISGKCDGVTPSNWLLDGGVWNDNGEWVDTEVWED